jgi:peptidyl-prolyl cis-trans isomerase D
MVTSPVRVSESEVFDAFSMEKSSATARMVAADYDWFGRFAVEMSDDAVKAYAETNKDAIDEKWKSAQSKWQADCPLVSQMLFRYPAGANDEEKAAQRRRADAAQALLKRQVPFATVARFSGDSPEAKMGGFLGCLTKDSGPAAETLLAAAQALKQGAVSPILESPQGLHILQSHGTLVESEAESRGRSYIARQLALDDAAKKKAEAFAVAVIAEGQKGTPLKDATEAVRERQLDLGDVSDAQRGSLVRLALEHPKVPQMEVSRTFTRQSSPIFGVKGGVNAAELVFALEKEDDYVSKPVERYSGYSVLQLKERTLATRDEFEKDKAAMILAVKEQKRADVLSNYVSRLRDKAENVKINPDYVGNTEQGEADRQSDSG